MAYLVIPNDPAYRKSRVEAFWNRVDTSDGDDACWPWLGWCYGNGYGSFKLKTGKVTTHRFAYEAAHGPIEKGLCVLHSCDNRKCCNPKHLRLGSQKDNIRDMIAKGRRGDTALRGEKHPDCKFSDAFIANALAIFAVSGLHQKVFAASIGMSYPHFNKIVRGKIRNHESLSLPAPPKPPA